MAQAAPTQLPGRPGPRPVVNFPTRRPPRWRWVLPLALIVIVAAGAVLWYTGQWQTLQRRLLGQSTAVTYQTTTVAKGTISDTVGATGPVAAAQTLPLSFKQSGKLAAVNVQVGQKVNKGDVLAQIDTTDLQAALDQAKANLQQAQANFNKAQVGSTPEQVQAAQVALQNAQQAANDAAAAASASQASAAKDVQASQDQAQSSQNGLQAAQDALAAAQDQAQKKIAADQTAVNNAQKSLDAANQVIATSPAVLKMQLEKAKDDLYSAQTSRDATCGRDHGAACAAANATVAGLQTSVDQFNATAAQTQKQNQQTLQTAQNALDTAKAALATDQAAQDAAVKTAQNNVTAAQASLNTAQTAIQQAQAKAASTSQSAKQSADTAQGQVKTAQASLATTSAGPTQADIDAAAAQVANAQVAVATAQNNLDGAKLTAPIDGTVTAISGTVGQWITGGAVSTSATSATGGIITLATLDDLQVTANVNEADVGKVKLKDPVTFTVSAFPGKTFTGEVTQIQPTGVTSSNVVNFAVTSSIKSVQGAALYPGMTANVTITAAEHKDVLVVPNSALTFARSTLQAGGGNGGGGAARATAVANGTAPAGGNGGQGGAAAQGGQAQGGQGQNGQGGQAQGGQGQGGQGQNGQGGQGRAQGQGGGQNRGQGQGQGGADTQPILVLENGQPRPVRVTVGMTDGTNTEIVSGLQEGQQVVTGSTGGTATARPAGAGNNANRNTSPLGGGGPGPGFRGG